MITQICYLIAGVLMGWLLRWKYTKDIFDALKRELEIMKDLIHEAEFDANKRAETIKKMLKEKKS